MLVVRPVKKPQRLAQLARSLFCSRLMRPIGFVDPNKIRGFHDSAFESLDLIAGPRKRDKQGEIHHPLNGGFVLAHAHRFNHDAREPRRFKQLNHLARLAVDAAQCPSRRAGTDEGTGGLSKHFHPGFVPEDTSVVLGTTWINGKNSDPMARFAPMRAQGFNQGAFSRAGVARDAESEGRRLIRRLRLQLR